MRPAGATGTDGSLPLSAAVGSDFPIGDGPLPDSDGGLVVLASRDTQSLDEIPTATTEALDGGGFVGADWSTEPYASPAPSGLGIDALAASEALRSAGWADPSTGASGPLLRGQDVLYMRPTPGGGPAPRIRPHHVLRRWLPAALVYAAVSGSEYVVLTKPCRAGEYLRLSPGADAVQVVSVSGGAGGWTATLAEPLTATVPADTVVRFSVLTWWDTHTWDLIRGAVSQDWTELAYDGTAPLILSTALSS